MDVQGSRNLVHEQLLESGKETTKQLKAVAQTFCVFIAWMTFFSHMDEIGYTIWAIFSSAVFPVMKTIVTINICLLQILMCLLLRAIVGWMISVIILTIARIPEVIFLLSVLPVNMFMNMICNGINNGASIWREINKYPPNTRHLRPVGTRVGFNGERIMFGGKSSSPRNHRSRFGGYLGYYALMVLSVLHDLALLHITCIQLGWPFICFGSTVLLYPIVGLYSQVKSLIQRSKSTILARLTSIKVLLFGHDLKDGGDRNGHDPKFGGDHNTPTSKGDDLKDGGDRNGHDPKFGGHHKMATSKGHDLDDGGDRNGHDSKSGGDHIGKTTAKFDGHFLLGSERGDHGETIPDPYDIHLSLDGTSIFNQWITAVSVNDVRKQIHQRLDQFIKKKKLKWAPSHFLLSAKMRGHMRFLSSTDELYDGIRIIISPCGGGGMRKQDNLKLPETPSPDRVPAPKFSQIPRPGISLAQRTTAASDEEPKGPVRFANVGDLESRLKDAETRAETETKRASVIEKQLEDMTETLKRLTEERDKTPTKRKIDFSASPGEKDSHEGGTAKVFLGQNPPALDNLTDVSDKKVIERLPVVVEWLESLRSWTQDTVTHGDVIFEALRNAADEFYLRWLYLSANPFKVTSITLEDISNGDDSLDHHYYEEFLLRSYGKITKALPKHLSSSLKEDVSSTTLTPFQKVAGIIVTVLTNFAVINLDEHTALFGSLHNPSQWLNGNHVKDGPTGSSSLVTYHRTLKFAQTLPRVTQLDVGRLTLGVRRLVNDIMSLLEKLEADEMSKEVRNQGLFAYDCKLESLIKIVQMCQNVARNSMSFKKNFKERSEKKDKDKKEREKREETNKRKRGNLAKATPEQSPSEHPVNTDQPTPSTAHQAKAKGKGQKGAKGTKGSGKNDEQKQTEQGTTGNGKAQSESNQDTQKPSPKLCSVCGKTLAEHPDKKWCVPLCYECKKPLDAHPNRRWCPRTKNGQSPSAPAGSPTPP